jgi:hypothetical protein
MDQFNKERGRKLALTRALWQLGLNKEERTAVWHRYFCRHLSNIKYLELTTEVAEVKDVE